MCSRADGAGRWLDDGYELTGSNAWQMVDDVVVGVELTVQQVLNVDRNAQKTQYQMYFAPPPTTAHLPSTRPRTTISIPPSPGVSPATVRLTWKWESNRGLTVNLR